MSIMYVCTLMQCGLINIAATVCVLQLVDILVIPVDFEEEEEKEKEGNKDKEKEKERRHYGNGDPAQ